MRKRAIVVLCCCILATGFVSTAAAQVRLLSEKKARRVADGFERRIHKVHRLLQAGRAKRAYESVSVLSAEMTNRFFAGDRVGEYLGVVSALRAAAAYQLGECDEAIWHWHVSSQLYPKGAKLDPALFGEAGAFLAGQKLRSTRGAKADAVQEANESSVDMQPPVKVYYPQPKIPAAKRGTGRVAVVVEVIIGTDGIPRRPRIVESEGELTLVYSTLDTLRQWRFKPARLDGELVTVCYTLTVDFHI